MVNIEELKLAIYQAALTTLPFFSGLLIVFVRETEQYKIPIFILSMFLLYAQMLLVMNIRNVFNRKREKWNI